MKKKLIAFAVIAALTLSGCSESNEKLHAITRPIKPHHTVSTSTTSQEPFDPSTIIDNSKPAIETVFSTDTPPDSEEQPLPDYSEPQITELQTAEPPPSTVADIINNEPEESEEHTETEKPHIIIVQTIEEIYDIPDPDDTAPKVTFYIDNQLVNSQNATIRLVKGYIDHPSLENLLVGNTATVPEGRYVLSVNVDKGYEISSYPELSIYCKQSDHFNTHQDTSRDEEVYRVSIEVKKSCENQTLIITGEIKNKSDNIYKWDDETFYSYYPDYRGKSFKYESHGLIDLNDTYYYTVLKNGSPLSPNDKLKVGDQLTITQHVYDPNTFTKNCEFKGVLLNYDDNGELSLNYTIVTEDIHPSRFDVKPEDNTIRLSAWSAWIDFTEWKYNVSVTKRTQGSGEFTVYKVSLDRNGNETLTEITPDTKLIPGNRLKIGIPSQYQNTFKGCNVKGGFLTKNGYIVVSDESITVTAVFR